MYSSQNHKQLMRRKCFCFKETQHMSEKYIQLCIAISLGKQREMGQVLKAYY